MTTADRLLDALALETALVLGGANFSPEYLEVVRAAFQRHRKLIIAAIYHAITLETA